MSDEKRMLGLNELGNLNLNAKLANQIAKRIGAPPPSDEALDNHLATVTALVDKHEVQALATQQAAAANSDVFFDTWDAYYPRFVSMLGWVSWMLPGSAKTSLTVIKSLLAVANNNLLPLVRTLMPLLSNKELLAEVQALIAAFQKRT